MTASIHAGSTAAESSLGKQIGKHLDAQTRPVWYMRAVKLPKCPTCGTPNIDEHNKICTGCGGPTAEPCEMRYVEEDIPRASMMQRVKRLFRKG